MTLEDLLKFSDIICDHISQAYKYFVIETMKSFWQVNHAVYNKRGEILEVVRFILSESRYLQQMLFLKYQENCLQ